MAEIKKKKRRIWLWVLLVILSIPPGLAVLFYYSFFIYKPTYSDDGKILAEYFVSMVDKGPVRFDEADFPKMETELKKGWDAVCQIYEYDIISKVLEKRGILEGSQYEYLPDNLYIDDGLRGLAFIYHQEKEVRVYVPRTQTNLSFDLPDCVAGQAFSFDVKKRIHEDTRIFMRVYFTED